MKRRKVIVGIFCILGVFFCAILSSCGKKAERFSSHSFDYFDTVTTITGYASDREEFERISQDVMGLLAEYHRLFTIYERYDGMVNLYTVNANRKDSPQGVKTDERIIDMLLYAKEMYQKTDGNMNIAMGSVLSVWHRYREMGLNDPKNAMLPPMESLLEASAHMNIHNLCIDRENGTVMITDPDMTLDVGAIAKGYAVEMAAQMLEEKGVSGYVINVGGNVRTVGAKPDGSPWLVGIENPGDDGTQPYLAYLHLSGESLVTSGSYQRYYIVDGQSYHHIIDPETLMPCERYRSVSVICRSSADGDALSTALFCMSLEEGMALVQTMEGIEAMWVFPDGEKRYSEGFSDYFADS